MTIGEKIKYLRKKNDITQEKLAEYLNITYQSVSKWENNTAMPDISLVIPLANFFGVTIDELFDRESGKMEKDIEGYLVKELELSQKGFIDERITLWRSAVIKYPKNYKSLQMLANSLWSSRNSKYLSFDEKVSNLKESIEINKRILEDCTDNVIRYSALQILVYSFKDNNYPFADEKKAVEYAEKAPPYFCSSDILLERAYYTEEGIKKAKLKRHQNNLSLIDHVTHNMRDCDSDTPEERIFTYESALRIWDALIYDGNYLFYHCRIADLYDAIAKNYALLDNRDKTLENLKFAKYHADKFDSQPNGELNYTSVFVSDAISDHSKYTKNYKESEAELIKNELLDNIYDFIRFDNEFIEFQNSF